MSASPHLVVTVGRTRLGVPEDRVAEAVPTAGITDTPLAPASVAGLTNHRGEVVVVLDLRHALGLGERDRTDDAPVVFVDTAMGLLGLLVEEIVAPTLVRTTALQPTPVTMVPAARRLVAGVARLHDQLLAIVDVDAAAAELTAPLQGPGVARGFTTV